MKIGLDAVQEIDQPRVPGLQSVADGGFRDVDLRRDLHGVARLQRDEILLDGSELAQEFLAQSALLVDHDQRRGQHAAQGGPAQAEGADRLGSFESCQMFGFGHGIVLFTRGENHTVTARVTGVA